MPASVIRRELTTTLKGASAAIQRAVRVLATASPLERGEAALLFRQEMATILTRAHTRAVYLGRYAGGDETPPDADDRVFAERVMRDEAQFLDRFVEAIGEGRYTLPDGSLQSRTVRERAELYLYRVQGTANEAWALTTPETLTWHLDETAENCEDCLSYAAGGPYDWHSLPAVPRDGSTACKTGCRCLLVTAAGETSFA